MIRLLIVDDEQITRNTLAKQPFWSDIGIDEIRLAKNGLDALQICEEYIPDILLCDVKMPKMNGIQLGYCIRERLPLCRIIYLSGYCDTEYLKSAIDIRAVSYIEKPINLQEIKDVVSKTVAALFAERTQNQHVPQGVYEGPKSLPYKQIDARSLLSMDAVDLNREELLQSIFKLKKGTLFQYHFSVYCVRFNWKKELSLQKFSDLYEEVMQSLVNHHFMAGVEIFPVSLHQKEYIYVLACFHQSVLTDELPGETAHKILLYILEKLGNRYELSIGVGSLSDSSVDIPISSQLALKRAEQQFYRGCRQVFLHDLQYAEKPFKLPQNALDLFRKLLRQNSVNEAVVLVDDVTKKIKDFRDPNTDHMKTIYFNLLAICISVAVEKGFIKEDFAESRFTWRDMESIATLQGLSEFIKGTVLDLYAEVSYSRNSKVNDVIAYVYNHYMDSNLSIASIADANYLSKTYLCALFKKKTNKTLNEFITEVRIEKAKELLNKDARLYEVADQVGVSDSNYFSTLFKKHEGCTPTEYKEGKGK